MKRILMMLIFLSLAASTYAQAPSLTAEPTAIGKTDVKPDKTLEAKHRKEIKKRRAQHRKQILKARKEVAKRVRDAKKPK